MRHKRPTVKPWYDRKGAVICRLHDSLNVGELGVDMYVLLHLLGTNGSTKSDLVRRMKPISPSTNATVSRYLACAWRRGLIGLKEKPKEVEAVPWYDQQGAVIYYVPDKLLVASDDNPDMEDLMACIFILGSTKSEIFSRLWKRQEARMDQKSYAKIFERKERLAVVLDQLLEYADARGFIESRR
jgi:hypothetical protein